MKSSFDSHKDQARISSFKALSRIEKARLDRAVQLDLSRLDLTEIPESIGQLQLLEILDISHNRLTTLPETIGQLQ